MTTIIEDENIRVDRLQLGPYANNAYIAVCRRTSESVLIDAPFEAAQIIEGLKGTHPQLILLTHNHPDHVAALEAVRSTLNIPIATHIDDAWNTSPPPERFLKDGESVSFGKIKLEVLHTPGHTPGSLCFRTGKYLFSGDTIFPGGPGKTKTPTHFLQIVQSITAKIFVLDDETLALPGHGDSTILKKEKDEFAVFSSRPHDALYGDVLWLSS